METGEEGFLEDLWFSITHLVELYSTCIIFRLYIWGLPQVQRLRLHASTAGFSSWLEN